ncbi:MAG: hypothetical protein K9H84_04965 [Bacteroidales bacterium]|nr:hypothetical protein [Bacteroidales bacterium]
MFYKTLYGYKIETDLDLPYLLDDDGNSSRGTVYVCAGKVPEKLTYPLVERKLFQAGEGMLRVIIPELCVFFIEAKGKNIHITYDAMQGASLRDISAYLVGSVFAGAMHLKDEFALHAGSMNIGNQTILIAGDSGAGKSSLIAEMLKQNAELVTDDVSVVDKKNNNPVIMPGHPNIRLWKDAAEVTGFQYSEDNKIGSMEPKYWIPVPQNYTGISKKIVKLFVLSGERTDSVQFNQVYGFDKVKIIRSINALRILIRALNRQPSFFKQAASLADIIDVYVVKRPEGYYSKLIADHIFNLIEMNQIKIKPNA